MQSSNSGSPDSLNLSSSVEGLVGGVESTGNRSRESSSSSHSTPKAPKKGSLKLKNSPSRGSSPAHSAGLPRPRSKELGRSRLSWREMMSQSSQNPEPMGIEVFDPNPNSGPAPSSTLGPDLSSHPGSLGFVETIPQQSLSLTREEHVQDNRQWNVHETTQQFQDARQVHQTVQQFVAHQGLDPNVVSEAVGAVTSARNEASQVVLQARSQVIEANAYFESQVSQLRSDLLAREAALGVAHERERLLNLKLEESMREIESLKSNLTNVTQNVTGSLESTINARITEIEKTLSSMLPHMERFHKVDVPSLANRCQSLEGIVQVLQSDLKQDRELIQDVHAELQQLKQDQWWDEPDTSPKAQAQSPPKSPQGHQGQPTGSRSVPVQPKGPGIYFDLFGEDDKSDHDSHEHDSQAKSSKDGDKDLESSSLRLKDLHYFKIPALPTDAGSYRSWKNTLRTSVMSFDRSTNGAVLAWFSKALTARTEHEKHELKVSSGDFPRFDRVLAAALCKPEHLRSSFGVRFQSYLESCDTSGVEARGRVMLNMVGSEYDVDRNAGAITTALELYNLPPPQDNAAALRLWRDKVIWVLGQISFQDQPEPKLLAKWLYDRLKRHPLMRRHIDRVRDADATDECRTYQWLWNRMEDSLKEQQQEANAISIQEVLKKGPTKAKPSNETAGGMLAHKGSKGDKDKGKGQGKNDKDGKGSKGDKGKSKGKDATKTKQDDKTGKKGDKGTGKSDLSSAQKAQMPCIYFAQGKCFREKCPFKHEKQEEQQAAAAKVKPMPKAGMVALIAATISAATATAVPDVQPTYLDFVGDTGAGEWLGSQGALLDQGVHHSVLNSVMGTSSRPLNFTTGGGMQNASETIGVWSQELNCAQNMYMLKTCPLVMSIGKLVHEGFGFYWGPNSMPYLETPSGDRLPAHRVDHNVPIFRLSCDVQHGLPLLTSTGVQGLAVESVDHCHSTHHAVRKANVGGIEPCEIVEKDDKSEVVPAQSADDEGEPVEVVPAQSADDKGEPVDDSEWISDLPPNHLMTHLPKSHACNTCRQAKLHELPHRRRSKQRKSLQEARDKEEPEKHLERISADFIVCSDTIGIHGEKVALVVVDRFSGMTGIYPSSERSSEEAEAGLRHFCGVRVPNVVEVASDREKGILRAIKQLGFVADPSPPNVDIHNPIAESAIRTVKGCAASLLLHCGMSPDHWPLAVRYLEFSYNVNTMSRTPLDPPMTCFGAAHGYDYEGFLIPFGALVWFRDHKANSFDPKGKAAIYLGVEMIDGLKQKGNHRVWSLENHAKGVFRETVVRSLSFPVGKWQFPLKEESKPNSVEDQPPPDFGGDGGNHDDDDEGNPDDHQLRNLKESKKDSPKPKSRNRAITTMRIAIFGKTPKCDGCKHGSYNHSPECRIRFNDLLDRDEPIRKDKSLPSGHEGEASSVIGSEPQQDEPLPAQSAEGEGNEIGDDYDSDCDYEPDLDPFMPEISESVEVPDDEELNEQAKALLATGNKVKDRVKLVERGCSAVASIFLEAIEFGGVEEEPLSARLANAMNAQASKPKVGKKPKGKTVWFVEFCCAKHSEISKLAEEMQIPYLGLSKEVCDLSNPHHMQQVMLWAKERGELGESFHLWGSLPCTPWSLWQNLNLHCLDETFRTNLMERRDESRILVDNFSALTDVALESGGSSSFEWPRYCSGWTEVQELSNMIAKHDMYSTYPTGCGFGLCINGKYPLKPWRIVTTNDRVAIEMDSKRCTHSKNHKHDHLEGGKLAYLSGFYNRAMATSILVSLYPEKFMEGVPAMPITVTCSDFHYGKKLERIADQLNHGNCLQDAQALVHRVLSKKEIKEDPKAGEAIKKEADEVRAMGVWDDSTVCELEALKKWAKQSGEKVHIAEVMEIGSIKNDELGPTLSQHKGRLVFRGDATRDENGLPAKFRELHSQPASIQIISLVMLYGLMQNMIVNIADCKKAYLQALLRSPIATWVILPFLCWLPKWKNTYKRPCVRLRRALYGHPEAGDDWFQHLSEVMETKMGFKPIEGMPSLWWDPKSRVLTAAYVDDIIASGPKEAIEKFWASLTSHVTVGEITVPGRFLGRDHTISHDGKSVFMSMKEYCISAVDMYLSIVGQKPLKRVSTPYLESELNAADWESKGELGEKSASILMKILWLARLSRPDLSHAVTKLASGITRWSINHDKLLYRLICYMSSTSDYGITASVFGGDLTLHLYTDADLGGDVCTMKSHSGIYLCAMCDKGTHFPISWTSRRQQCVSRSTTESEIVALSDGLFSDAIPVQTVLQLVLGHDVPLVLHEDNQACIHILNSGYSARMKSMNRTHKLSIAALHESIQNLELKLEYTESEKQLADMFTKALAKVKFQAALTKLNIGPTH